MNLKQTSQKQFLSCFLLHLMITSTTKGRRGCALVSSLLEANWDGQTDKRAGTSKYRDACASKNNEMFLFSAQVAHICNRGEWLGPSH